MFFDRYEIHIQAFLLFINGKLIIFQSSSPPNIFFTHIHNKITRNSKKIEKHRNEIDKIWYLGHTDFDFFLKFCEVQIDKTNIFPR